MEMIKPQIIKLLAYDMRLKLYFQGAVYDSIIAGIVSELMGISEEDITWEWFDIYMNFLNQASQYEITADGKNLLPLAEACYIALTECVKREQEKQ